MQKKKFTIQGLSIIEIILAMALFIIFATGTVASVLGSFSSIRLAEEQSEAGLLMQEGVDAVQSIRNQNWNSLTTGAKGLVKTGNVWSFSGTSDVTDKFTRVVTITNVYRNAAGDIVSSGGSLDQETKKVSVTVTWNFGGTRDNGVVTDLYLTRWQAAKNPNALTPTPTPTLVILPTSAPTTCSAYCATTLQTGSCIKAHKCTGANAGKILDCQRSDSCCCQ